MPRQGGKWMVQPVAIDSAFLPRPAPGAPPPGPIGSVNGGDAPRADAKRGRVLIVEDEYFVALDAELALADAGFEVVGQAATAAAALQLATLHRPDIVVMDIRLMGTRDGIDAATEILTTLGIHSMFASAHIDAATRRRGEATGASVGWLAKPYSSSQLEAAVLASLAEARKRSGQQ